MKLKITAALVAAAVLPIAPTSTTVAAERGKQTLCEQAYNVRQAVIKKHGKRSPGRNICRFGVQSKFNSKWSKPATTKQKATYIRRMKGLITPPPTPTLLVRTAVPPSQPPAGTLSPSVKAPAGGTLASIARCESGGNPGAVSPNGLYRGKYQFDQGTWNSVGGSGDPAAAPEATQDRLAAKLYAQRGAQPWPVCGK